METMADANDGLQFKVDAFDAQGSLRSYAITARYGQNSTATIFSASYTPTMGGEWTGVQNTIVSTNPGEWIPPVTCAYEFAVWATSRVTNGYHYIGDSRDARFLTVLKPGSTAAVGLAPKFLDVTPLGL